MSEPKDKFSISMDPELVRRLDKVGEARGDARSTVIERIVRNGLPEEERFLEQMENPAYRAIVQLLTESPKVTETLARLVGEHLGAEQLEKLKQQAERGKARQKVRRASGRVLHE